MMMFITEQIVGVANKRAVGAEDERAYPRIYLDDDPTALLCVQTLLRGPEERAGRALPATHVRRPAALRPPVRAVPHPPVQAPHPPIDVIDRMALATRRTS